MTSRGTFQPKLFYFSNKNDWETMLSGVPFSTCTSPCRETSLRFSLHDSRGFFLKCSGPPERCRLPRPLACPSRASTRRADNLPPGCPDAGSARARHAICTPGTNKSGGPSAVLLARQSRGRWYVPLRGAAWAQARSTAQDCAFLL